MALWIPHSHCPFGHEHPQPFLDLIPPVFGLREDAGTRAGLHELCGACWFEEKQKTEMVSCTEGACAGSKAPGEDA